MAETPLERSRSDHGSPEQEPNEGYDFDVDYHYEPLVPGQVRIVTLF